MPLIKGHSARARAANIRTLVSEGYPQRQAVAIAYDIARRARAEEDDEMGDVLSEDFWISPTDAKEALDAVLKSAQSLDMDMRNAVAGGSLPAAEGAEWAKWYRQLQAYYRTVTESFLGWRLVDSTGVLHHAEMMATDLGMWRQRFEAIAKTAPTTAPPVRTHAGPVQGPMSAVLTGLAAVGAVGLIWRIYLDVTR